MKLPHYHQKLRIEQKRKLVREMLRIIFGSFISQRLRRMRPRDGRRHGPYVAVARSLGLPVSARDVRWVWTGRDIVGHTGKNALDRIVAAIERQL